MICEAQQLGRLWTLWLLDLLSNSWAASRVIAGDKILVRQKVAGVKM